MVYDDAPTLSEQKMCADQALKTFKDTQPSEQLTRTIRYSFTDHYDPKERVCYLETRAVLAIDYKSYTNSELISDAFEGRVYGSLMTVSNPDHVEECSVKPKGQTEIKCSSNDDFDKLALQYFGTTPD
jgi:hypothetical protein